MLWPTLACHFLHGLLYHTSDLDRNIVVQIMLSDGRITELEASARSKIAGIIESMAKQSLRCLAFASKTNLGGLAGYDGASHAGHKLLMDPGNYSQLESELVWLGVAGLQDPPRPEVASAIAECHAAGIHVSHSLDNVCNSFASCSS